LQNNFKDKIIIGGFDRFSPMSGLCHKFEGFKEFLKRNPNYAKKYVLIQVKNIIVYFNSIVLPLSTEQKIWKR
jgi:trehalose-6-phosphate synthase